MSTRNKVTEGKRMAEREGKAAVGEGELGREKEMIGKGESGDGGNEVVGRLSREGEDFARSRPTVIMYHANAGRFMTKITVGVRARADGIGCAMRG